MTFQRIVCYAMLFACALVFIYSLGLSTDLYDSLYSTMMDPEDLSYTTVEGSRIYYDIQPFNTAFTNVSIVLILVTLVLFITQTHVRRKYYIGNFVSVGLSAVANVAASVWALANIMAFRSQYKNGVDFEALKSHSELWKTYYTDSTFWFDASIFVFGLLLLATVLLVVNLILKIIVMKEEKRLIGQGKEVLA